jgi:hypothetical protein
MAWEFHEFDESDAPEVFVTIGRACEDGEHERCAGFSTDTEGMAWCCTCFCHKVEGKTS